MLIYSHNLGHPEGMLRNGSTVGRKSLFKIITYMRQTKPALMMLQEINDSATRFIVKPFARNHIKYKAIHSFTDHYANDAEEKVNPSKGLHKALAIIYDPAILTLTLKTVIDRVMIATGALADGTTVAVINVHLSAHGFYKTLGKVKRAIDEMTESLIIIGGDFNSHPQKTIKPGEEYKTNTAVHGWFYYHWAKSKNEIESTTKADTKCLDYIMINQSGYTISVDRTVDFATENNDFDHYPLICKKVKWNVDAAPFVPREGHVS